MKQEGEKKEIKRIMFKCLNCMTETNIAEGVNTSVVCQSCGCLDIQFDSPVEMYPVKPDQSFGSPEILDKGDLAYGRNSWGIMWSVKRVKKIESTGTEPSVGEQAPPDEEKPPGELKEPRILKPSRKVTP
jgi:hypothetical protein